jgi:hypothetical protein
MFFYYINSGERLVIQVFRYSGIQETPTIPPELILDLLLKSSKTEHSLSQ